MLTLLLVVSLQAPAGDWPVYGHDAGGTRFSALAQITRANVAQLEVAWTYHTGMPPLDNMGHRPPALEVTPIVVDGTMYVSTPTGIVAALDPATGTERWRFDAGVDPHRGYGDFVSRGVSFWRDTRRHPTTAGETCTRRIFVATIDARLFALDAVTGKPCLGFGSGGVVDLRAGLRVAPFEFQAYEETSPPAVVGDLVIVGSGVADNASLAPASGEVRAFDARTGRLQWTFDPIPQDSTDPAYKTWQNGSAKTTGAANVWTAIVADPQRDLVFLPTSSPAPDYFGGRRLGDDRYANSIVALRASTGKVVWHFQIVHHDLWDFDNASPPALVTITRNGGGTAIPAVVQTNKSGMMYVFDRTTGAPVFPIEERPVPASTIPGEVASRTQPFTAVIPPLVPLRYTADDAWGPTPEAKAACHDLLAGLENKGPFTPPSTQGILQQPGNIGGAHWGGVAIDEGRGLAVVPVNRLPAMVQLFPADGFNFDSVRHADADRGINNFEYTRMRGTPYVMRRRIILSPAGLPCTPPPFGALVAVNLNTGAIQWNVPLGTFGGQPGSPQLGGPIVTAGGLVFIGATLDRGFRAFDVETGRELWKTDLPAGARATPMTYEAGGRQFVVIAAGGSDVWGSGEAIIAFALPK